MGLAHLWHPMSSRNPFNFPQIEARRYRGALLRAQQAIERSGQAVLGPGVAGFEADLASWMGRGLRAEQVIGVANGTDAIELALHACGVRAGDPVAMPSHTAYATAAAVLRLGAVPLFVDIAASRPVIDASALRIRLAQPPSGLSVKAVIAVHLYGEACDLQELLKVCREHGVPLIEDCAQACGSQYRGERVGTWGDYACFSFYPTKNLAACGDGGALVTRAEGESLEQIRRLRFYGWDRSREAVQWGVNSRLDEIQALLLQAKLQHLAQRINQRRRVAEWYRQGLSPLLSNTALRKLPADGPDWRHSYHLYVIEVDPECRPALLEYCLSKGIPAGVHYPKACHQQAFLQNLATWTNRKECVASREALPNTERLVSQILTLPLHPYLGRNAVERVLRVVRQGLKNN
jgi:dTDP-3-amino-2,3,6-trideoxy-4-keto-D-glucose/dTDP-3-amino-3,4,6-trideoxy-alpha-D-glucose/dTDP-2,6-dideoxy-D-kanosamine transaminase